MTGALRRPASTTRAHRFSQPPIGESAAMRELRAQAEAISGRNSTVVVFGESGTGKELTARYIHACSPRSDKPFIAVDCTTLRETLLESQLFGHVKGAFTGADTATIGFFRAADGGTLFLDEIGEMDLPAQAKLLRCIQDRAVVPLGGVEPIPVDVRIIAATHRDLKAMVSRGAFRQDLYYRLNVVRLTVPALRERPTDIGQLAEHFLVTYARLEDEAPKRIAPAAIRALEQHDWKGNVRELANVIEQAHVLSSGREIAVDDLPEEIRLAAAAPIAGESDEVLPLATVERMLVARALRVANGNQSQAARMLEIDRRRLYRKVRQHKLQSLVNPRRGAGDAGCR